VGPVSRELADFSGHDSHQTAMIAPTMKMAIQPKAVASK
jgi:hypothetical protein